MKRQLLPVAIGAVVASYHGVAMSDATVYGKLNLSVQQNQFEYVPDTDTGTENTLRDHKDNWEMFNNASRLGVKGKSKINDDLDAVYKMEFEVVADNGTSSSNGSPFNSRNIYAGLSSKQFGQLIGGKNDTPLKMAADGTDMMNDLQLGDIREYMVGENRESNILIYNTPEMAGFTVTVASVLGEESGVNPDTATAAKGDVNTQDNGLGSKMSATIKYKLDDSFWVALSGDDNIQNTDIIRLNTQLAINDFTFNLHVQDAKVHDDNLLEDDNLPGGVKHKAGEGIGGSNGIANALGLAMGSKSSAGNQYYKSIEKQSGYMLNGKYQMGDWAFKAQYGHSASDTFKEAGDHTFGATQKAVGVDYALNKNTTVFTYLSRIDVNTDHIAAAPGAEYGNGSFRTGGVGLEVKF